MVFSNFVKSAKHSEKLQFFQSSYPYLNNNTLVSFHHIYNTRWSNEEPHPSTTSKRFLCIANGHYGLYYTMFNHDADRNKSKQAQNILNYEYIANYNEPKLRVDNFDSSTRFFISKVNQDIYNNINYLKSVSKQFLSTLSILKPKFKLACPSRKFSTVAYNRKRHLPVENIEDIIEVEQQCGSKENLKEGSFESNLLNTQVSNIQSIYSSYKEPHELNLIYPLYQSLKRNDINLPSSGLYNIVLDSIIKRSLDNSEFTIESIESSLTTLLTVYQDMLTASVKPNNESYNIVLNGLFKGSLDVIEIGNSTNSLQIIYNESFVKSQEFCKIGIDLLLSIKNTQVLNLPEILPKLLEILNYHPNLINKELINEVLSLLPFEINNGNYFVGLIGLTKYFQQFKIFASNERLYEFIVSIYQNYKNNSQQFPNLLELEYDIYSSLIQTLIKNDNFPMATKFLDDILIDYKNSLTDLDKPTKAQISNLLSIYLQSIMDIDFSLENLNKSYNLLMKFNEISYLPELSVSLYNEMINNFIYHYNCLEMEKQKQSLSIKNEEVQVIQFSYYQIIWKLYNYVAIRRDFQDKEFNLKSIMFNNKKVHCRDFLISLSIDLGDHERIFQLIKEVLLKDHLIQDLNVFKKLVSYLYNGSTVYGLNSYYFELMWNLIENQSIHYQSNSKHLNYFISELVNYLILQENEYNVGLLTNSIMIGKAFDKFDLESGNVYGLLTISKFLVNYTSKNNSINSQYLFKILQYQSLLINEFENIENHYLELDHELIEFKGLLKSNFMHLIDQTNALKDFKFSEDIVNACKIYDIQVPGLDNETFINEKDMSYDLNLSYILTVNYGIGIEKFIELFNNGYKFNKRTWTILINSNFILDVLESNSIIKIKDFVSRIFQSEFRNSDKVNLLNDLINIKNDKVNINIIKYLMETQYLLRDKSLILNLITSLESTSNKYLKKLIEDNFKIFYENNTDLEWVNQYFKVLINDGDHKLVNYFANEFNLVDDLNLFDRNEFELLISVLNSLIKIGEFDQFNGLIKNNFSNSAELNKLMVNSSDLISLLIKYYTLNGSHDLILNKFKSYEDKSIEIKKSILFTKLMKSLTDSDFQIDDIQIQTLNELSITLINSDLSRMNYLYEANKHLVKNNKDELITLTLNNIIKAGLINDNLKNSQVPLVKRFQNFLKFLKLINFKRLSSDHLIQIIKFLTIADSRDILNILLNKLLINNSLSNLVNFYFMDVMLSTPGDKLKVLKTLNDSFNYVNDPINLHIIKEYCDQNHVRLMKSDEFKNEVNSLLI